MKVFLLALFSLSSMSLIADMSPAFPPHPYDTTGKTSPMFTAANAAAIHYLTIIDNQVYGGSWLESGGLTQDLIPQEIWAHGLRAVRLKLGVVKARKVSSFRTMTSLPGGTEGNFMTIEYETQFSRKPVAIERVMLVMQPPLGLWKVISYAVD